MTDFRSRHSWLNAYWSEGGASEVMKHRYGSYIWKYHKYLIWKKKVSLLSFRSYACWSHWILIFFFFGGWCKAKLGLFVNCLLRDHYMSFSYYFKWTTDKFANQSIMASKKTPNFPESTGFLLFHPFSITTSPISVIKHLTFPRLLCMSSILTSDDEPDKML